MTNQTKCKKAALCPEFVEDKGMEDEKSRSESLWGQGEESKERKDEKKRFDLEERTAIFGEKIIDFVKSLPNNVINEELIRQIVRSGPGIGANYNEADGAESKKDFRHKIAICKKESKETKHWLRMIGRANPGRTNECRVLWREAHEFTLIFSSILRK